MHKAAKPSFLSRHRLFIITASVWAVVAGAIVYFFYRFPYAVDIFDLNATGSSLTENSILIILLALGCAAFATLLDSYVRDRRRVMYQTRPATKLSDELFSPRN